ncbi:hypothetical protein GA0115240_138215 [Streptomyces sp. DvalAA-14]|uniref:hypothetical protein n=1 Tax=unclassified Streptomyces TaxID=2593676 RepID=UPI00081B7836|nr:MULTISPECIES: hypothetical protein [unclassified Streptomyces]MYS22107.1 hypothetical protein [Streptomyces sp. SID4948]SCE08760.1 hypothetical protein GA0115240_138215 [Streptomyces sp. DvalAA-14]
MTSTQDPAGGGLPAPGAQPTGYNRGVFSRIDHGARLSLYRVLLIPLVLALTLAFHPWTWGGSSGSAGPGDGYNPAPYDTSTDDGSGGFLPTDTATTDPDPGTPSPTDDGQTEAAALDALITQSADSRAKVSAAVNDAEQCGAGLSDDAAAFQDAADSRSSLAQQAGNASMDAVLGGPDAALLLSTALSRSADADADYARWAQALAGGDCAPSTTQSQRDFLAGGKDSTKAQQAKSDFVDAWNPIAAQYGLATRSPDEF